MEDNDCICQIIAQLPGIGNIAFLGHSLASGLQGKRARIYLNMIAVINDGQLTGWIWHCVFRRISNRLVCCMYDRRRWFALQCVPKLFLAVDLSCATMAHKHLTGMAQDSGKPCEKQKKHMRGKSSVCFILLTNVRHIQCDK